MTLLPDTSSGRSADVDVFHQLMVELAPAGDVTRLRKGGCWLRMPAGLRLEAGEPPGEARQPRYLFLGTPLSPSHLPAFHDQPANSYHAAFALNLIHPGNLQNNHLQ